MPTITALRVANKRKGTIRIELDGEPWLEIDAEVLVRMRLSRGMGLDAEALRSIEEEEQFVQARRKAVNYCALQPRTLREVERLLAGARFAPGIAERALNEAVALGAVSDEAAARRAALRGQRKKTGPRRVRAELAARGADSRLADSAVKALEDPDWQAAQVEELARARLARLGDSPADERRRKVGDHLMRRGFDPEIVGEVLARLIGESEASEE